MQSDELDWQLGRVVNDLSDLETISEMQHLQLPMLAVRSRNPQRSGHRMNRFDLASLLVSLR